MRFIEIMSNRVLCSCNMEFSGQTSEEIQDKTVDRISFQLLDEIL